MRRKEPTKEVLGLNRITKKQILQLCRKDKLYQTPELNDVLYLHYQGFEYIECLEDYTELKCLWLESNAISEIQGLSNQTKLKCLFLQSNLIRKIENLEYCKELDTLNLSQNHIRKIENCGFEVLPVLNTLNLSSNYLKDSDGLKELENCKNLSVLDLANNRIDDILVVKIFSQMPELKVLVLQGNPVVSKIPQYRKTLILECKKLTYLDSRPVFLKDRACAEAWKRGGYDEERKENERWIRKDRKKMRDSVNATIQLRNKNRKLEDQISLIPSSDSEEDTTKRKENVNIKVNPEFSMDSVWDEVAEDKTSSESSLGSDTSNSESNQASESSHNEELNDNMITSKEYGGNAVQESSSGLERSNSQSSLDDVDNNLQEIHTTDSGIAQEEEEKCEDVMETIENDEDNYEPLEELEENMAIFDKESYEQTSKQLRTKTELKFQQGATVQDCCDSIHTLEEDFEELTTNLSNIVNELEQQQEQRQEIMEALFSKELAAKESSSESSDNEEQISLEKLKLQSIVDEWDSRTKINKGPNENQERIKLNENFRGNLTSRFTTYNNKESAETFNYIPLDISLSKRTTNEALSLLEKESRELKELLQKLENNTKELFKENFGTEVASCIDQIDKSQDFSTTDDVQENKEYSNVKDETNKEDLVEANQENSKDIADIILDEVLQSLKLQHFKPKSYEFPDDLNEYCDDNEPSADIITEPVQLSKSIPEVIKSFNEFFNNIEINHQQRNKSSFEELQKYREKSIIFKDLCEQPNLKQFNSDTHESLDAELKQIKIQQQEKVRRLVNRVFAQKDRYNDTLELVNNKLMVRKKDTEELQELPEPPANIQSDSENDYNTAESDNEDENIKQNSKKGKLRHKTNQTIAPRKSSEELVMNALIENTKNNSRRSQDISEESDEEFYSLNEHNKQNLYDIDKEFFNKLTFGLTNLTEVDENHIVQCARSYEELKHCLTISKEERCLTEEENELLDNMSQTRYVNLNDTSSNLLKTCGDLSEAEQLWFNKNAPEFKEPKSEESLNKKQYYENTTNDEVAMEMKMGKIFLKNFAGEAESDQCLHEKLSKESYCFVEQQSEEEKNEYEYNIDFESGAANTKIIECKERHEISKQNFNIETDKEDIPIVECNTDADSTTDATTTVETSCNKAVEVIECNMEIIGDNNEIVNTLTVNAENIQF